jgi:hypothetical protein
MWASAILTALKSLPVLAESLKDLSILIKNTQDDILDKYIKDIKESNEKILNEIAEAKTDEKLKELIKKLNSNLHR